MKLKSTITRHVSEQDVVRARLLVNLLYILPDIVEACLMDNDEASRRIGQQLRFDQRRHFNAALHALRELKRSITRIPPEAQEAYGEDSDMIYDILLSLVDRTALQLPILNRISQYIKSFPSKMGITTLNDPKQ